ncbi:Ntox44 domain-containing protein [Bacillus sp. IT-79MI2]|uniref:polymorphic toxin type 44 domain-containing protein n=1 Tax=Bacillus sp. IT-79MI2 TaxID=3026438 RepID=UPI00383850AA
MKKYVKVLSLTTILFSSFALTPVSAETESLEKNITEKQLQEVANYQLPPELEAQAEKLAQEIARETLQQENELGISSNLVKKRNKLASFSMQPSNSTPSNSIPGYNITADFSNLMRSNRVRMESVSKQAALIQQKNIDPIQGLAQSRAYTYSVFIKLVKTGGPWDYKLKYGPKNEYVFDNQKLTGEDIGNFHFGYVGKAIGFTDIELKGGAGFYQILSKTSEWAYYKTYFDEPKDQKMIQLGIDYYNKGY